MSALSRGNPTSILIPDAAGTATDRFGTSTISDRRQIDMFAASV
jgi:hypothetical protein